MAVFQALRAVEFQFPEEVDNIIQMEMTPKIITIRYIIKRYKTFSHTEILNFCIQSSSLYRSYKVKHMGVSDN